ncbi:hypothetical protein L3X38_011925 [Prunus dulcis]|uniref:Uncharacterized protein n=1 Tax=Prunus dulcis TaxID=3755 RepID=A0AAD4ZG55_PRUDU|nr:hypothetical protein L3X38_011925 [Prunus dulcis]
MKKQRDRCTAETVGVVLNFFSVQLSVGRPRGRLEPAVDDVGCPKKPTGHGIAMNFTRDAVLFQSRVRGPNSEVGAQICGLPDLPLHARRSSSSSVASAKLPKKQRDRRTAETVGVVLNFFSVQLSLRRPRGRLEPAGR